MVHYTQTNRPCSLWANLWSEAFEVLSEEAECVQHGLIHNLSPQQNRKPSSIRVHICPCCIQQQPFLLSLRKRKGKNGEEKSYLANFQRLSPDNWAWNKASCLLFAKVTDDSWLDIRQGGSSAIQGKWLPQSGCFWAILKRTFSSWNA